MEIPESIKDEFIAKGGIEGLKEKLPDNQQIERFSAIFHGLSDPVRVKILFLTDVQPVCVCILRKILNISYSKLSYHLSALMKSGLIFSRREGKWIIYQSTKLGKTLLSKCLEENLR